MARGGRPRKKITRPARRISKKIFSEKPPPPPPIKIIKPIKLKPIPKFSPKPPSPTRARTGGLKGRKRKTKPIGLRSRPRPTRVTRPRPTRVTVASPSGREGRTITVSSKSVLARPESKFTLGGLRRKRKTKPTGLRSRPRPTRPIPKKQKFGSDFDIFRVSDVGGQAVTFKKSTRTGRTGKKKPTGIPQTTIRTTVSRVGKPKKPQPRLPPSESPFVQGLFDIPLFIPRQVGKAVTQVTERISKKPLPKEERAFGSDFDVLNFFG